MWITPWSPIFMLDFLTPQEIEILPRRLPGLLTMPEGAKGIVVFAHGSGSSRLSPRNTRVARALNEAQLATLLFDLLLPHEAEDRRNVFDIPLLATRLEEALGWLKGEEVLAPLAVGLFGASTGAAAALVAACRQPDQVSAVVSRGGRPDLAAGSLARVKAPTLLIVGGRDELVIDLNERAMDELKCEKRLEIVPRATHLFEEPGTLDVVISLAAAWFVRFLGRVSES
ncbi:MAG: alpha/beta family hydrolase [Hyphomicrobium sp.]|jgi:pimeloyl-ACP methyl ester carboxylesterase